MRSGSTASPEAFARVIDAKSPFTARHSERVAEVADGIAQVLGFTDEERRTLRRAGLLHDIGKLAVSNRVLDKPGKLTDDEFTAIKTHPVYSLQILERAPCFAGLADLAANHHEKLDGSGYPRGLTAENLDLSDARARRGRHLRGAHRLTVLTGRRYHPKRRSRSSTTMFPRSSIPRPAGALGVLRRRDPGRDSGLTGLLVT